MQPSQIFKALRRRWYATAAIVLAAVAIGFAFDKALGSAPQGTATVQILVDSPVSALVNLGANQAGLESRASVLAQAMSSNAVTAAIANAAHVPASEVTAQGPYTGTGEALDVATPSEARGMQVGSATALYRLTIQAQQDLPIVTVGVQGPTPEQAGALANQVLAGTNAWLATLTTGSQVKSGGLVHLRQLGDAQAGSVNSSSGKVIGMIGAVAILMLGVLAIALTDPERRDRRRRERERAEELLMAALEHRDASDPPVPVGSGAANGHRRRVAPGEEALAEEFASATAERWLEKIAGEPRQTTEHRDESQQAPDEISAPGGEQRQA